MGRRKQNNSRQSQTLTSYYYAPKATTQNQTKARQLDVMEIEKKEASFSHLTDKIQQQFDSFQGQNGDFWKNKEGPFELNLNKQEASASQSAVHLKIDEFSNDGDESKMRKTKGNREGASDTNPWANPKGIVKKTRSMNIQGNQQVQSLEKRPQRKESEKRKVEMQKGHGFLRQGLKNLGNTCFCNALFQCLFDVLQFRDSILNTSKSKDQGILLRNLCNFFENLKQRSRHTQQAYSTFVKSLFNQRKDQFQIGTQGDSCILFRALLEELAREGGSEELPYLRIFRGGDFVKNIECPECQEKKVITETLKILDVKDLNFNKENMGNFFQSASELRVCRSCRKKGEFICQYEVTEFPEILVIKVHETVNYKEKTKVAPLLEFETKTLGGNGKVRYGLVSAVVNELRGEKGYHSMELSYQKGDYFLVDDHRGCEGAAREFEA